MIMKSSFCFFSVLACILALLLSCSNKVENVEDDVSYPKSKVWAHRVNTPAEANEKIKCFDGIEIDLVYDASTGELMVSHEIDYDAKMTFREYLQGVCEPDKPCYWLDMKNLDLNAEAICDTILSLAEDFGFIKKFFVESWHSYALNIAKEKGIKTSLWVDNLYGMENPDIDEWFSKVSSGINIAHPDAISADHRMWKLVVSYFPDMNINLWQTPTLLNDENVELTKEICRDQHVKVLLVDYEKPPM